MTTTIEHEAETPQPPSPRKLTTAPLRYVMTAPVKSNPEDALRVVLDFEALPKYLTSIKKVDMECDSAGNPSVRVCTVSGMGQVKEAITWFDEELGYAYSADAPGLPMKNHLGVATVKPASQGGSIIRWESYFDWRGMLKPVMMKLMFPGMMRSLGKGLQRDLGAAGAVDGSWA
ncbi:MAG: SRPBCC family protein [Planctomycetota bacterium]